MNKKVTAHLSVLFANIIYGANYSIAKEVMPSLIKPFGFIVIRVCTAAILFLLTYLLLFREKIERRDWPRLFACAVFGVSTCFGYCLWKQRRYVVDHFWRKYFIRHKQSNW